MWCSASSCTTSCTSLAGTSGICTFLMISSRPQIAIALPVALMPDLETALLIASMTVRESLMVPSVIASGGSEAVPSAASLWDPTTSGCGCAFNELDQTSLANTSEVLHKNGMEN